MFFFGSQTSLNLFRIITHPAYINLQQIIGTLALTITWLALFNIIPAEYLALVSIYTCIMIFNSLTLNLEILFHVLKTFDFWYVFLQSVIWAISFCIIIPDVKRMYPILWFVHSILASLSDPMPPVYRKHMVPGYVFGSVVCFFTIICVHFHLFPDLRDHSMNIYGMQWGVRQMHEAAAVNMLIYFARYGLTYFYYSHEVLQLKMYVKREQKNV